MSKTFELLSVRRFTMADQQAFADMTGDANPLHLDSIWARRTQAGVCVVHGINALMWMLDRFCSVVPDARVASVAVNFVRFIPLETDVELYVHHGSDARLELRLQGAQLIRVTVLGYVRSTGPTLELPASDTPLPPPAQPLDKTADQISSAHGRMKFKPAAGYPHLEAGIGPAAMAGMGSLSTLVGMIAPGLHSMFAGADLVFSNAETEPGVLAYRSADLHEVFNLLTIDVAARGVSGSVRAFLRPAPVEQPSWSQLANTVKPGTFASVRALVIGGSRGLGALTAKLLAIGGAEVGITYSRGLVEAEAVAADILAHGGKCTLMKVDATLPLEPQLEAKLLHLPNQVYYFASGRIFGQHMGFSDKVFEDFSRIYVIAFAELCRFLIRKKLPVVVYYPSSTAVVERPAGMTEYAMTKAAAEILCSDHDRDDSRLRVLVDRLPRLLTDQTASITPVETESPLPIMQRALRTMHQILDDIPT